MQNYIGSDDMMDTEPHAPDCPYTVRDALLARLDAEAEMQGMPR